MTKKKFRFEKDDIVACFGDSKNEDCTLNVFSCLYFSLHFSAVLRLCQLTAVTLTCHARLRAKFLIKV